MPSPNDNRGSNSNWHSGLKVIENRRRSRSCPRWDSENSKTVEQKHKNPKQIVCNDEWERGTKILKESSTSAKPLKITDDDWHGINKTIDNPTYHSGTQSTWTIENFKVLPPKEEKRIDFTNADKQNWHSGLYKTVARRGRSSVETFSETQSSRTRSRSAKLPSEGRWATENLKVLEGNEASSLRFRSYASQSRTGVPRFVRDDDWSSGLKTVDEEHPVYQTHDWHEQNRKVLDEPLRRPQIKEFVVSGTGWDSGLFKTLSSNGTGKSERRRPSTSTPALSEWTIQRKTIPRDQQHSRRRFEISGTGWDSGLKTVSEHSHHKKSAGSNKYWNVENRKTLPFECSTVSSHINEFNRHVMEPRRNDMLEFHQRLCRNRAVHAF